MLTLEDANGQKRIFIFKNSRDEKEKLYNIKKKIIENSMILVTGTTGSGKSVLVENLAYEYYKKGYKVIYLSNKPKSEFDTAFLTFPPFEQYHLDILEKAGIKPLTKQQTHSMLHLIHPLTTQIPKGKLPPIDFFGFSLKKLSEESLASLMVGDVDSQKVRVCLNICEKLKNDENAWDMLYKMYQNITTKKDVINKDPDDLFIPIKTMGTNTTMQNIRDSFRFIRENMFLLPHGHKKVINMQNILNDQARITILCTNWGLSKRERYFTILQCLSELEDTIRSAKYPVLLVLEEMKVLLPKRQSDKVSYEKFLSRRTRDLLSTLRSAGKGTTIIATTQNRWDIDQSFANSFSENLFGVLNMHDKAHIRKNITTDSEIIKGLDDLGRGEFCWWEDCVRDNVFTKFMGYMPPFCHGEERFNFFDVYKRIFPENLTNYSYIVDEMISERKEIERVMMERLIRLEENERVENAKKEVKDNQNTGNSGVVGDTINRSIIKTVKDKKKYEKMKKCYDFKKNDNFSWRKIAKEMKISSHTAKKWAMDYARSVGDQEFIVVVQIEG